MHQHFQKFLRFRWLKQDFEFTCLPFRLASAPRVFTKVMRTVISHLRERGFRCGRPFVNEQKPRSSKGGNPISLKHILETLGFLVNYPKSQLRPIQEVEYLRFLISSTCKELQLPRSKVDQIKSEAVRPQTEAYRH